MSTETTNNSVTSSATTSVSGDIIDLIKARSDPTELKKAIDSVSKAMVTNSEELKTDEFSSSVGDHIKHWGRILKETFDAGHVCLMASIHAIAGNNWKENVIGEPTKDFDGMVYTTTVVYQPSIIYVPRTKENFNILLKNSAVKKLVGISTVPVYTPSLSFIIQWEDAETFVTSLGIKIGKPTNLVKETKTCAFPFSKRVESLADKRFSSPGHFLWPRFVFDYLCNTETAPEKGFNRGPSPRETLRGIKADKTGVEEMMDALFIEVRIINATPNIV